MQVRGARDGARNSGKGAIPARRRDSAARPGLLSMVLLRESQLQLEYGQELLG